MNSPLTLKLLSLAFDPAAHEGEADAAFRKLRSMLLASGADIETFRESIGVERTVQVVRYVEKPVDPYSPTLRFGKHKGKSVAQLARTREGKDYLYWVLKNCDRISNTLKDSIREELGLDDD